LEFISTGLSLKHLHVWAISFTILFF